MPASLKKGVTFRSMSIAVLACIFCFANAWTFLKPHYRMPGDLVYGTFFAILGIVTLALIAYGVRVSGNRGASK